MSSPFPQLLRRANIATYDPLITRIYTSTPSSKSQHSDWGLKFPVNLPKGPRYIKFSSLDAGPGINCDWRSGEREARFIQAWGNGGVRWSIEGDIPPPQTKRVSIYEKASPSQFTERDLVEDRDEASLASDKEWMRDVESMSADEFESYLERIRSERKKFLQEGLDSLAESTRQTLALPEDHTLVHLASTGKTTAGASASFQARLTSSDLLDPESRKIHSQPHRVHGLSYSRSPISSSDFNPALDKKGRALNKLSRSEDAYSRSRSNAVFAKSRAGNNLPYVVGLGGLTGKTSTDKRTLSQASSDASYTVADEIDYTRSDLARGTGNFRVNRAQLKTPPSVLALKQSRASGGRVGGRWKTSSSAPSPLDTFRYDIEVALTSSPEADEPESSSIEVGSREWVGQDMKVDRMKRLTAELNIGAPRRERTQGEALERLKVKEEKEQTMDRLNRLLKKAKAANSGDQA